MERLTVHRFYRLLAVVLFCGLLTGIAQADTYHLTDGTTVTGDLISMDERGVVLRGADGNYMDRLPWGKFSQEDLKQFQGNPKATQFVEPFIEITPAEKMKKTEIEVKDVAEK